MKIVLHIFFLVSASSAFSQQTYYFVSGKSEQTAWNSAVNSANFITINYDTGWIEGQYSGNRFKGSFDLEVRSSGFVKGFNYGVKLGYLQRDITPENSSFNQVTTHLSQANRFYLYPDNLNDRTWNFLEIFRPETEEKMVLVSRAK